jgi:hypothetical protein
MAAYLIGGIFALAGVALTGFLAEFRATRESRSQEISNLASLKREVYSKAINQVELVASMVARWVGANEEERPERSHSFWDELVVAYQMQNQIKILARTQEPAEAMNRVLGIYRRAIENHEKELPKPREEVKEMVSSFRKDLGLTS